MSDETQSRLQVFSGVVHPWHHDTFGHMNVRHYAALFDDATFHLWSKIGLSHKQIQTDHGVHTVTAQASTTFIKELTHGDLVTIDGAVSRLGTKSVSFQLQMHHAETGEKHAAYDTVEVFFDPNTRTSTAMPDAVRAILAKYAID